MGGSRVRGRERKKWRPTSASRLPSATQESTSASRDLNPKEVSACGRSYGRASHHGGSLIGLSIRAHDYSSGVRRAKQAELPMAARTVALVPGPSETRGLAAAGRVSTASLA
jgi:hypothetical protein